MCHSSDNLMKIKRLTSAVDRHVSEFSPGCHYFNSYVVPQCTQQHIHGEIRGSKANGHLKESRRRLFQGSFVHSRCDSELIGCSVRTGRWTKAKLSGRR